MKSKRSVARTKIIHLLITAGIMIFLLTACAVKAPFLNSTVVPAAEGHVQIKTDKNKNYEINIVINNLALPGRLQPSKNAYIVWMDDGNGNTKNIGQIKTSTSFLSKALKASFKSISSFKPVKIFITSEYEANVQFPSTSIVLTTNNF